MFRFLNYFVLLSLSPDPFFLAAGMASAGVNELASPLLDGMDNSTQNIVSGVIGGLSAGLVGGEDQISTGQTIAQSGTVYNRQLHQDEIKFIKNTISKFKLDNKETLVSGRIDEYSDSQAQRLLMTAAKYMVDESSQNEFKDNTKYVNQNEFSKGELQTAINYLKSSSEGMAFVDTYKESMLGQNFFTSTPEQFKDSSWTPDNIIGLGDQGLGPFVPVGRVGQVAGNATKEISPIIIKKTGQVYDDVTLGAIGQANKVAPNLMNKYLINNVKVNESLIDSTTDYFLLGIPSPSKIGYGVGGYGLITDFLEKNKDK